METTTKTAIVAKVIHEKQINLVLTLTPKEIKTLLTLGNTSHCDRVKFLESVRNVSNEQANDCSNLLAEMYFAAARYKKENSL